MSNIFKTDFEPAWSGRLLYGSVFGAYCGLGIFGVVLCFMKTGNYRFFAGTCALAMFIVALHSLILAMRIAPPKKNLSRLVSFLVILVALPLALRIFFQ
jgi:hypothetical protein